jgi:hypothetical protein
MVVPPLVPAAIRVTRARCLVAVALLASALVACGHEGPSAPAPTTPPALGLRFERPPNSMEGLPGGALTLVLTSTTERPAGAHLAKDDPLVAAFHAEAAKQRELLTLRGVRLAETFARDDWAAKLWTEAVSRLQVTRSRDRSDGTFDVVVQADLADLFHHITGE